jgi:hypothetical protein
MPGHQPATATRLPHAAGALQDVGEVLRATDRDHAPEFGELDRADAGWQGRGRAQGGSWSRVQSRGNRPGDHVGARRPNGRCETFSCCQGPYSALDKSKPARRAGPYGRRDQCQWRQAKSASRCGGLLVGRPLRVRLLWQSCRRPAWRWKPKPFQVLHKTFLRACGGVQKARDALTLELLLCSG